VTAVSKAGQLGSLKERLGLIHASFCSATRWHDILCHTHISFCVQDYYSNRSLNNNHYKCTN